MAAVALLGALRCPPSYFPHFVGEVEIIPEYFPLWLPLIIGAVYAPCLRYHHSAFMSLGKLSQSYALAGFSSSATAGSGYDSSYLTKEVGMLQ